MEPLVIEGDPIPDGVDPLQFRDLAGVGDPPRWSYRWPKVATDPVVQCRYESMRRDGQAHRIAEMLATRTFPGVRTDATFNRGRCNGNQFERTPGLGDHHRKLAEAAGVSTTGRYYSHALASFPGDPEAWVADRHDVLEVARRRGYHVTGDVEYHPPAREPAPDVTIADDLVAREVDEVMALDGGYRREDVEERVRQLRSGAIDLGATDATD